MTDNPYNKRKIDDLTEEPGSSKEQKKESVIVSLDIEDKQPLSSRQKIEHVDYGPTFCSDLILSYDNTHYHVHKCTMATESIFFRQLLEKYIEKQTKPIELPVITSLDGCISSKWTYNKWLFMLYKSEPVVREQCEYKGKETDTKETKVNFYLMAAVCDYFQSPRVENELQKIMVSFMDLNVSYSDTESQKGLYKYLNTAITYNWDKAIKRSKYHLAKVLKEIRKQKNYDSSSWLKLAPAMREAILEKALDRFSGNY